MRENAGITTMSLIIYVIAMILVIGIIATITSFFYQNVINLDDESANISEITKFHMHFLQEVKNKGNSILSFDDKSIRFTSGNTFTFQDNCIYLNNIRICEKVKNVQFNIEEINNKKIINVLVTMGENVEYTKVTKYVMNANR